MSPTRKRAQLRMPPVVRRAAALIVDLDNLTVDQKFLLTTAMVGYALKVFDFSDMHRRMNSFCLPKEMNRLRAACVEDFNLTVRLKQAVYRCIELEKKGEAITTARRREIFVASGLAAADSYVFEQLRQMRLLTRVRQKLRHLHSATVQTPTQLADNCSKQLATIDEFIKKFVYRKLRFIAKSNRMELSDLENELRLKATQVFYYETPFKSEQHVINTVKRAVHHHGMNLIQYYTTQKRGRLVSVENGHQNMVQDIYSRNRDGEEFETPYQKDGEDVEGAMTLNISVRTLLDSVKGKKREDAIKLLMLEDHPEFVAYFNKTHARVRKYQHVEDIYRAQRSNQHFLELVRQYLDIESSTFYGFINLLRSELKNG